MVADESFLGEPDSRRVLMPELRGPPADPFVERVRKRERTFEADGAGDDFHFIVGDGE